MVSTANNALMHPLCGTAPGGRVFDFIRNVAGASDTCVDVLRL